ncbi:MAG: HAD family hydrolase [Firmicutes bacterium]|jgi:FMN phosphatase YigB (HAD superfamily)|nr:HAD family hydrolase [Bacillota bacterium]
MLRYLFFDLDGTLLPVETDFFFYHYMSALRPNFSHLIPPEEFDRHLLGSTKKMVTDADPSLTNEEVFWGDFSARTGYPRAELEPVFQQFYEEQFPALQKHVEAELPGPAREILESALAAGFSLVIATNAIFPEMAIRERLAWINCHDLPFAFVTTFENMHFCKPNPQYYQEILDILQVSPGDCLMIGNDPEEDLTAAFLGMKTCLITDYLVPREKPVHPPDFSCRLVELPGLLKDLAPAG